MLSRQVLLKRQWLRLGHKCMYLRNVSQATDEQKIVRLDVETRLAKRDNVEPQREPFVKNLFLGKFDRDFLTYPQFYGDERLKQYNGFLKSVEDFIKNTIDEEKINRKAPFPKELFDRLKELNVFRATIDEEYNGLALNNTEYTRLIEVLSSIPALGVYFTHQFMPVYIISKYGTAEQKKKYLPKLASGEITAAMCVTEKESGANAMCIKALATLSDCENYWTLNGEKVYVPNALNADIFIVFTLCLQSGEIFNPVNLLTPLIVERERDGVCITDAVQTLSEHGLTLCTVTFKDTVVPRQNLIGQIGIANAILLDLFSTGKHNIGAQAVAILRNFINLVVKHVINEKHFDRPMHEISIIQGVIGDLSASLYAMESVTYLTTGLMDQYIDQDCVIESAIVKSFCTNECITCIQKGLDILGIHGYIKTSPYENILRDALALTLYDGSNYDTNVHIGLLGLRHAGGDIHEDIYKNRNIYNNPAQAFKQIFKSETKRLKLHLIEYLHPSLQYAADVLEESVLYLKNSTETMLERHGYEVSEKQMEVDKLSEMVILIYVLVAIAGRASRSYCIGLRNSECETRTATLSAYNTFVRMKVLLENLRYGEYSNGDHLKKQISQDTFESKKYAIEHPLTRNW